MLESVVFSLFVSRPDSYFLRIYAHLGISMQQFFMWYHKLRINICGWKHSKWNRFCCLNFTHWSYFDLSSLLSSDCIGSRKYERNKWALFSGKTHHMIHHEHCTWPLCLSMCVHICVRQRMNGTLHMSSLHVTACSTLICVCRVTQAIQ